MILSIIIVILKKKKKLSMENMSQFSVYFIALNAHSPVTQALYRHASIY